MVYNKWFKLGENMYTNLSQIWPQVTLISCSSSIGMDADLQHCMLMTIQMFSITEAHYSHILKLLVWLVKCCCSRTTNLRYLPSNGAPWHQQSGAITYRTCRLAHAVCGWALSWWKTWHSCCKIDKVTNMLINPMDVFSTGQCSIHQHQGRAWVVSEESSVALRNAL